MAALVGTISKNSTASLTYDMSDTWRHPERNIMAPANEVSERAAANTHESAPAFRAPLNSTLPPRGARVSGSAGHRLALRRSHLLTWRLIEVPSTMFWYVFKNWISFTCGADQRHARGDLRLKADNPVVYGPVSQELSNSTHRPVAE